MTRDTGRGRVYEAEIQFRLLLDQGVIADIKTVRIAGSTIVLPIERKFGDLEGVQRYVDLVLGLHSVRATYPEEAHQPITVRERQGDAQAHYQLGTISVPPHKGSRHSWAMREIVILHEIAHHLSPGGADHGPGFIEALTFLITEIMGLEAGFILQSLLVGTDATT